MLAALAPCGGRGGGKETAAQGQGPDGSKVDEAVAAARAFAEERMTAEGGKARAQGSAWRRAREREASGAARGEDPPHATARHGRACDRRIAHGSAH
eukprot:CAMPEP_0206024730 /NCGR_PEP_ID=MMETSP1464-20131121/38732_1 /ASSEMBLY_ACC=CAM_ASM_001124 /TAXON_ID=119497 /ORGANISM="Exanthemachrysis gayraliae, Strain RCC1523" /LENGTH=96 /DNA_ID=CAMNT_0053398749 /DNA_START=1 /DNA_END=289 /DNA_ORIENTATION=+